MNGLKKWLITGAEGQLGKELNLFLLDKNVEVLALSRADLDITNSNRVSVVFDSFKPNFVVNCAAWTDVEAAEENFELAFDANCKGAGYVADAALKNGSKLIQISTDYVFGGESESPNKIDGITNPQTIYGKSKLQGELLVSKIMQNNYYILRTGWLYGAYGNNFAKKVIENLKARQQMSVVSNQFGQPTWTRDLAKQISILSQGDYNSGIYHATNSGITNWFNFAREIAILINGDVNSILPEAIQSLKFKANRPLNSSLDLDDWAVQGLEPMRNWKSALNEFIKQSKYL